MHTDTVSNDVAQANGRPRGIHASHASIGCTCIGIHIVIYMYNAAATHTAGPLDLYLSLVPPRHRYSLKKK